MLSIRKIGVIGRTYRHLNRYRQILSVLLKYGFDDLVDRLHIDQYIEIGRRIIAAGGQPVTRLPRARRFRMALEELGPTYIKLGQVLSTRSDLLPPPVIQELTHLQDDVPGCRFEEIRKQIERELRAPVEQVFAHLDETPLAAASIGQVHRGRLPGGDEVAVKVQRPGLKEIVEVDVEIMLHLATLAERHIEELALHRPVALVEEFARQMEREIDYLQEAENMERFSRAFLGDPTVFVPRVDPDRTSERVLTAELVTGGIKISDIDRLDAAGIDRKVVTERGALLFLRQVFDHGFFHADPHPGNIFVLPNNVICLLDFGMMGTVDRATREDFVDLLDGAVNGDERRVSRSLLKLTRTEMEPDIRALERDLVDFMSQYLHRPLGEIRIGRVMHHLFGVTARHGLSIPPDLFLMMKAFSTVEGVALALDPAFDLISRARPFLERVKLARYSPHRISEDLLQLSTELVGFLRSFPQESLEIARRIRRGQLRLQVDQPNIDRVLNTNDRISNKLSFSIIIAALLIGSALIVISEIPPLFFGISLIGIFVFTAAAVMGIWLLVAILRKGGL